MTQVAVWQRAMSVTQLFRFRIILYQLRRPNGDRRKASSSITWCTICCNGTFNLRKTKVEGNKFGINTSSLISWLVRTTPSYYWGEKVYFRDTLIGNSWRKTALAFFQFKVIFCSYRFKAVGMNRRSERITFTGSLQIEMYKWYLCCKDLLWTHM